MNLENMARSGIATAGLGVVLNLSGSVIENTKIEAIGVAVFYLGVCGVAPYVIKLIKSPSNYN